MSGDIEVLYKRDPNFFYGAEIQGFKNEVLVALNEKDEIVAVGGRTLKKVYVNGFLKTIGYLSDLRVGKNARHLHILANGYREMGELMQMTPAYMHLTTIIEDNKQARAALTWKNKHKFIPNYFDVGRINTYFVLPIFKKNFFKKFEIRNGSVGNIDEIVTFLNQEGAKKQFFPLYTKEYFMKLRGFNLSDLYVAYSKGKVVGVSAKWKQSSFKQVVLKKYHGKMRWIKKILGHFLPDENEEIEHIYLAFNVVKNNDLTIFKALFAKIYNDLHKSTVKYFVIAFHEKDPLQKALKGYIKITYKSRLYIADYKTDEELKALIDDRIPYIEVATL